MPMKAVRIETPMPLKFKAFNAPAMTMYCNRASKALGKDYWVVLSSFSYYIGDKAGNRTVTVPAVYLTDGATVPRIFWATIPPWGDHGQAVILHDYLCENLLIQHNGKYVSITRKEADEILLEALEVCGVSKLKRYTIFTFVSVFRILFNRKKPNINYKKRHIENEIRSGFGC